MVVLPAATALNLDRLGFSVGGVAAAAILVCRAAGPHLSFYSAARRGPTS
jgi:hypothetical protein